MKKITPLEVREVECVCVAQRQREELCSLVHQHYRFLMDLAHTDTKDRFALVNLLQRHFERFRGGRQDLTEKSVETVLGTYGGVKKHARELLVQYPEIVKSFPEYDKQVVDLYVSDKLRRRFFDPAR